MVKKKSSSRFKSLGSPAKVDAATGRNINSLKRVEETDGYKPGGLLKSSLHNKGNERKSLTCRRSSNPKAKDKTL